MEARGGAEAEGMRLKAQAFSQYGEVHIHIHNWPFLNSNNILQAATMGMVLDSLPGIAAEVSCEIMILRR